MSRSNLRGFGRMLRDRSGVSALEFALTFPVMVALLTGMVEIASMVQTLSRDKAAAHSVADLVSRCRTVADADITDDFTAAALIIAEAKTLPSDVSILVASVSFAAQGGAATLDWSKSEGASPPTLAAVLSMAAGKAPSGASIIVAAVNYTYSVVGESVPPLIFSQYAFSAPRLVTKVPLSTACDWSL